MIPDFLWYKYDVHEGELWPHARTLTYVMGGHKINNNLHELLIYGEPPAVIEAPGVRATLSPSS